MGTTTGIQDIMANAAVLSDVQEEIVDALTDVDLKLGKLEDAVRADDLGLYDPIKYGATPATASTIVGGTPAVHVGTSISGLTSTGSTGHDSHGNAFTIYTDADGNQYSVYVSAHTHPAPGGQGGSTTVTTYTYSVYEGVNGNDPSGGTLTTTTSYKPGDPASDQAGMFKVSLISDNLTKLASVISKADKSIRDNRSAIGKQWIA